MAQESFNLSGMQNKFAMDKINVAFKSIQNLIDTYKPKTTEQDYAVLIFSGELEVGQEWYVDKYPLTTTVIYGLYGTTYIRVGTISTTGKFVSEVNGKYVIWQPYRQDKIANKTALKHDFEGGTQNGSSKD